jgi:uncharacterized protein YdbL (DUF1318 family)
MTRKAFFLAGLGAALIGLGAAAAYAQRDPAYAAARAAGQVGEQPDGYLGVVSGGGDVQAIVNNINIQRKAAYTRSAAAAGATVEQFAFTSGCNLVAQTKPGEMYRTPGGSWEKRGAGAPQRDPRCA